MNAQKELLELIAACRKFGEAHIDPKCHWSIEITPTRNNVAFHTMGDHGDGLAVMRTVGLEDAEKTNYDPDQPWHTMVGNITPETVIKIFCQGLPPMCHIETYEEEVPKEQIVQTGEKTIVRRSRICCGEQK